MSGLSAYTSTPRIIKRHVERCMLAGVVPFIQSSPAMGKSAIVRLLAEMYGLKLIDIRLSTCTPEDLNGLPHFVDGKATFMPFDMFPLKGDELPEGYNGWLLFCDEFNSASKAVQAAAYKLVLDHAVGQNPLHERCVIVCAGNLSTDRAIVNALGTAMQSRLVHLKMEFNQDRPQAVREFLEDVAFPQKWDKRIIAFLGYKPAYLYDFRPDHDDSTFCGPRTWEFMNKLISGHEVKQEDAALYAGTITSGVAVEFITFTEVFANLPQIRTIVKDPQGTPVPNDAATRYATITHVLEHADEDNFGDVATYINKFTSELRVLFFRGLMIQKPLLKKHPAFIKSMLELQRYMYDDDAAAAA